MSGGKLHIDVTQLVHWQGKLTGIPRVMNEISNRYLNEPEVEFIVWDVPSSRYLKIDINKTLSNRGRKIYYANTQNSSSSLTFFSFRVLRKLKTKGLPVPGRFLEVLSSRATSGDEQKFTAGDMLFVLWGEWANQAFIKQIINLHHKNVKLIQVAYDLLPLVTPQYSGHSTNSMRGYNKAIFPLCSLIFSISEHTKTDVQKWLKFQGLKSPKVAVFRLGDDFQIAKPEYPSDPLFKSSNLKGQDYILIVGTIEARKNHTLLYYTYKLALSRKIPLPKIVIVGRRGWLTENIYEILKLDPDIKDQFVIMEGASDEELSWLYKHAMFSLYPSFYEGWGLPIAESIAHGTPCACSNTSSMPEVAGDLVSYFSPYSPDECLAAIQNLLNPSVLEKQRESIKKYKPTTWDETFEQINREIKALI